MKFLRIIRFVIPFLAAGLLFHCPKSNNGTEFEINPLLFLPQPTNTVGCNGSIPNIGLSSKTATVKAGKTAWYRFQSTSGSPATQTVNLTYPVATTDNVDLYMGDVDKPLVDILLATAWDKQPAGAANTLNTPSLTLGQWVCIGVNATTCPGDGICDFTITVL